MTNLTKLHHRFSGVSRRLLSEWIDLNSLKCTAEIRDNLSLWSNFLYANIEQVHDLLKNCFSVRHHKFHKLLQCFHSQFWTDFCLKYFVTIRSLLFQRCCIVLTRTEVKRGHFLDRGAGMKFVNYNFWYPQIKLSSLNFASNVKRI